jgi:aryl-alcohol dehydrogenase-like predicted oxidoreductase
MGAMPINALYTGANADNEEGVRAIHRALDLGVTHIDTAETYGPFLNEELVGKALQGRRDQVVPASKFGFVSYSGRPEGSLDSSPESIRVAVEGSLKRLGTDYIDLLYQHRVDPATPIEETVGAMAELVEEGKVRALGLSEAGPGTIRRAHAVHPLTAVQTEYSLWFREPEREVRRRRRPRGGRPRPEDPAAHRRPRARPALLRLRQRPVALCLDAARRARRAHGARVPRRRGGPRLGRVRAEAR